MSGSDTPKPEPDLLDVDEVASTNPRVDMGKFLEAEAALAELRNAGVPREEYDITSPYARRPPLGPRGHGRARPN